MEGALSPQDAKDPARLIYEVWNSGMIKGDEKVELFEIVTLAVPSFPFLVVIRITPDAALEPYNAAAAGPLRTDMLSMSSGLMSDIPSPLG